MAEKLKLVVIVTNGFNDERSSVAWSVANQARLNPLDPPARDMIQTVVDNGGKILVCPPCAGVRGYEADDLMDGVTLAGSVAMLEKVKQGAATITF